MRRLYLTLLIAFINTTPLSSGFAQTKHKIALVLSGGGARGAAHIGVLRIFEREHIPIDCITGTSFGALAGGLYAMGYSTNEIERIISGQDWDTIFSDAPERRLTPLLERRNSRYQAQVFFRRWNPELPTGFRGGQRLTEVLDILTTSRMLRAGYDFDKLPIQFRAVATNLVNGNAYVFKQGSMTDALRASMAIPLLFTPLEKDDMLLVDGGLANNLPTDIARDLGADIVIAVDTTSPLQKKGMIRNFLDVVDQSISLQMEKNVRENRKLATLVLQPDLQNLTYADYDKIPGIIARGEEEATRHLSEIRALTAGMPPRPPPTPAPMVVLPRIRSVSFRGLVHIPASQLTPSIHMRAEGTVDAAAIGRDVGRLYASRLFESVTYSLEPLAGNRYDLVYNVKETPLKALGAGLRYDNDFTFVALAEFTARQLFNSPSTATISTQFGGLENHVAALRLTPQAAPFFFIEPRVEVLRLERLDVRDKEVVDRFTEKRETGRLVIGGSFFKQLEISGGYRYDRVRLDGGQEPNRLTGSQNLAGITFRLNRDTLDSREFPGGGMMLHFQVDKRSRSLGSDLDYSRWELDYQRALSVSPKSTIQIGSNLGYSRGPVPFYDLFFTGGRSYSQVASLPFIGLRRDEFSVRQMAIVSASYRRLLFTRLFSLIRRGFITGTYNGMYSSVQQKRPYNFSYLNGAGFGIDLDTILGPVRASGGWAEGGRFSFYISVGPSF
jgi:NTE family protein